MGKQTASGPDVRGAPPIYAIENGSKRALSLVFQEPRKFGDIHFLKIIISRLARGTKLLDDLLLVYNGVKEIFIIRFIPL